MRTEIKKAIITHTQGLKFGYWDERREEFIPINLALDDLEKEKVAKVLKTSTELLEALITTFGDYTDTITVDLLDIWQRLDVLDERLDKLSRSTE